MPDVTIASPMAIGGVTTTDADKLALALKVFSGETLTAFARASVTNGKFIKRTIQSGKSAQFPVFGRTKAHYLKAGKSLDDIRENIQQGERTIVIDGLLTSDCLVFDLDEFIAHYDFRSPYAAQLGEALAISMDASVLAEVAKEALNPNENVAGLGHGGKIEQTLPAGSTLGINKETGVAVRQLLLEAKAKMANNYVPATDRYAFVTPDIHAALASNLDFLNSQYGAAATLSNSNVINMDGFQIIECPHLTAGGDDPTNTIQGDGHVFPKDGTGDDATAFNQPILICHKSSVGILSLKDISFEQARRPEYQADQLIAKYAIGIGGLRPESTFIGVLNNGGDASTTTILTKEAADGLYLGKTAKAANATHADAAGKVDHKLTVNGKQYDGSADVDAGTTASGGATTK